MHVTADLIQARAERTVELAEGSNALALLKALDLAPDAHLILRGDLPVPLDAPLVEAERIRILAVVSGGIT